MALARALAAEPKVLLLDEPFGALDAQVRKELRRWLRKLHDEIHVTSLFVTHDQEEALEVADEVVIFNKGKIEQVGTPDQVYNEPASPFVLQFLGQVNIFHGRIEEGQALLPDGSPLVHGQEAATGTATAEEPGEGGGRAYVRPHEIDLVPLETPAESDAQKETAGINGHRIARIAWIHRAGATVKIEVQLEATGQVVVAELPRTEYARLKLERGQRVLVLPRDARIFPGDFQI